jgi:hypothetical protein
VSYFALQKHPGTGSHRGCETANVCSAKALSHIVLKQGLRRAMDQFASERDGQESDMPLLMLHNVSKRRKIQGAVCPVHRHSLAARESANGYRSFAAVDGGRTAV